jgi:putative ABC transport system substrate-binding protein
MVSEFPEAGVLMSYGANVNDNVRRAATFVDRILKGAKPGELPFESPMRYYLIVNRSTAKSLGIAIPQELVLRADRVIE